jgi:hypothetical protein
MTKAYTPEELEEIKIACVKQFMDTFQTPMDPEFWNKLVLEELTEAEEALKHLLKELADLQYVLIGRMIGSHHTGTSVPFSPQVQVRAQTIALVASGIENGLKRGIVDQAFLKVHESNMSKANPDGSVLRRADGKVLKGPNYKEADLNDLL